MATHAFSSSSIGRIPNLAHDVAFVTTPESSHRNPSHRISHPAPARPFDRDEVVASEREERTRRAAFRRPGAAVPHARIAHVRRESTGRNSANPNSANPKLGRALPAAGDPSPVPVLARPAQRRRNVPFLTWTRLLLGRDGLAAVSMTGVFAILLFL